MSEYSAKDLARLPNKVCVISITQCNRRPFIIHKETSLSIIANKYYIEEFSYYWNRPYKCLYKPSTTSGCIINNLVYFAEKIWDPHHTVQISRKYKCKIGYDMVTPIGSYDPRNKYCLDYLMEEMDLSSYPKITAQGMRILKKYTGYVPKIVLWDFYFGKVNCQCDELIIPGLIDESDDDNFVDKLREFLSTANVRFINMRMQVDNREKITEMEFEKTKLELYIIIVNGKSVRIPGLEAAMQSQSVKSAAMI